MVLGTATGVYKNVGFYMKYYSRPKLHAEWKILKALTDQIIQFSSKSRYID
jgi:hypothetical protein